MTRPSQILVLGMHRSGTSAVARLLNFMGAYFGADEMALGAAEQNPKGFWERKDVRAANDAAMLTLDSDWQRVGAFEVEALGEAAIENFNASALPILEELNAHRSWMVKEPRMCLLLPLWKPLLAGAVCVHVHRDPLEVARSLQTRNGHPLHLGLALWEKYSLRSFRDSQGLPRFQIQHRQLMVDPVGTVRRMQEQLEALGVEGLKMPDESKITDFIDPNLYRSKGDEASAEAYLNADQLRLRDLIESDEILRMSEMPLLSKAADDHLRSFDAMETRRLKLAAELETQILTAVDTDRKYQMLEKDYLSLRDRHDALKEELKTLGKRPGSGAKSVEKLFRLLDEAEQATDQLLRSTPWKLGNVLRLRFSAGSDGKVQHERLEKSLRRLRQEMESLKEAQGNADGAAKVESENEGAIP